MKIIPYRDLGDEEEDERIRQIGEKAMVQKLTVGFITDDEPGKADRYISKLQERYPGICVLARMAGPVANTVLVKVGPPLTALHDGALRTDTIS